MKRLKVYTIAVAIFMAAALTAGADTFPQPLGVVSDFANVISSADEQQITQIANAVRNATGAQIAVVSVDTLEPYGSIEEYSIELATEWGIGESGKDNGVLLLVAIAERKLRVEVGYGLEGAIPDGVAGRIRDQSMGPSFSAGNFGDGFIKGTEAVAGLIAKDAGVELSGVSTAESQRYTQSSGSGRSSLYPFVMILVFILFGGGRIFWPLLFLGGMGRRRYTRGGFGSSSRGGFGGGGFSSGGGGSFGGGSFGGGGASGSF